MEESCTTAEEFTKVYYESVDKRRHVSIKHSQILKNFLINQLISQLMSRLYLDDGLLVWNGNGSNGKENIQKFFHDLPVSEHTIVTLDAQPIMEAPGFPQQTYLIQVSGVVKFVDSPPRPFQQTFMVTAQVDKWKVASDCFRLQDAICADKK